MRLHQSAKIVILAAAVFILAPNVSAQSSDGEKFAEARVAIDQYKDCAAGLKALEGVSQEGRKNPMWIFYAAKAQECNGNLQAALELYQRYNELVPGQIEIVNKIGELRYKVNAGELAGSSATLEETLSFIERAVSENGTFSMSSNMESSTKVKFDGCQVTHTWKQNWTSNEQMSVLLQDVENKFNLGDIDPEKVHAANYDWTWAVEMVAKGEAKKIFSRHEAYRDAQKTVLSSKGKAESHFVDVSVRRKDIAQRLTRAFKHAVTLCNNSKSKDPF